MQISKPFAFGSLTGTIFDFTEAGDILPRHSHQAGSVHISIVARGSFKAAGEGWEKTLPCGAVVDWQADRWHEFTALENDSRLVNVVKDN